MPQARPPTVSSARNTIETVFAFDETIFHEPLPLSG
jgi:hypothetical protein